MSEKDNKGINQYLFFDVLIIISFAGGCFFNHWVPFLVLFLMASTGFLSD